MIKTIKSFVKDVRLLMFVFQLEERQKNQIKDSYNNNIEQKPFNSRKIIKQLLLLLLYPIAGAGICIILISPLILLYILFGRGGIIIPLGTISILALIGSLGYVGIDMIKYELETRNQKKRKLI